MTTQLFKAKDVRSAISKVTEEFGDEAIILSTKKNNGFVEIEASNNNEVLTSFPRKNEESKVFSKIFYKKLDENNLTLPQKRDEVKKTESTQEKIKRPINNFENDERASRLSSLNLDEEFINPINILEEDLTTEKEAAGSIFGGILAFFFVMYVITGSMYRQLT